MLQWLGLRGKENTDELPLWAGVSRKAKWICFTAWASVGAMVFFLMRLRLPEDDGFGGFLPVLAALTLFIAGSSVTERGMLRTTNTEHSTAAPNM